MPAPGAPELEEPRAWVVVLDSSTGNDDTALALELGKDGTVDWDREPCCAEAPLPVPTTSSGASVARIVSRRSIPDSSGNLKRSHSVDTGCRCADATTVENAIRRSFQQGYADDRRRSFSDADLYRLEKAGAEPDGRALRQYQWLRHLGGSRLWRLSGGTRRTVSSRLASTRSAGLRSLTSLTSFRSFRSRSTVSGVSLAESLFTNFRSLILWNEQSLKVFPEEGRPAGLLGHLSSLLMVTVMAAATVGTFSDMLGMGPWVYQALFEVEFLGWPLLGVAALVAILLYGVHSCWWTKLRWVVALLLLTSSSLAGLLCMTAQYPESALIVAALNHLAVLVLARRVTAGRIAAQSFHTAVGISCAAVSLLLMATWAWWSYTMRYGWGSRSRDRMKEELASSFNFYGIKSWNFCVHLRQLRNHLRDRRALTSCSQLELSAFLIWSCPLLESGFLLCSAIFCGLRAWHCRKVAILGTSWKESWMVQRIFVLCFLLVVVGWIACAIGGASMELTSTLLRLVGVIILAMSGWVVHAVPLRSSLARTANSLLWRVLQPARSSDWTKASVLCLGGLLLGTFLLFDSTVGLVQRLLRRFSGGLWQPGVTTERGEFLVGALSAWHWPSVMLKASLIALLLTLAFVVTPKASILCLAWLLQAIEELDLWLVTLVYGFVGLALFALPPLPGLAVYMGAGSVLVAHTKYHGWSFVHGVAYASGVSLMIKLIAVAVQYLLFGRFLARTSRVRRLVGVHKESTVAIRRILEQPGLNLDKAAILSCGPDWPTAVLCGVLGVGFWRTFLGNLPVVLLVVPYTYAGACWLDDNLMEVSRLTILVVCLLQNVAFAAAILFAAAQASNFSEELKRSRVEHNKLHDEDAHVRQLSRHYKRFTAWVLLGPTQRVSLLLAVSLEWLALWVSCLLGPSCFREFSLQSKISDNFEDGGLNGNPLNILRPLGYVVGAFYFGGALCIVVYLVETRYRIRSLGEAAAPPKRKPRLRHSREGSGVPRLKCTCLHCPCMPSIRRTSGQPRSWAGSSSESYASHDQGVVLQCLELGGCATPVVTFI